MSSAGLDWQLCFVGSVLRKQCRSVQRRMLRVSAACLHRHGFEGTHAHAHKESPEPGGADLHLFTPAEVHSTLRSRQEVHKDRQQR